MPSGRVGFARRDALVVSGLRKRFRNGQEALREVSFSVAEGECLGVVGPNGSGKSTLLRMLATVIPPTSGSASVLGRDLVSERSAIRSLVGYVPQDTTVDPTLTCRDNLRFHCMLHGAGGADSRARVSALLDRLDLVAHAEKPAGNLSGGLRKRLDIGCALVHSPSFLVLDEPTLGLDASARERVWALIRELRDDGGATVILSTHYEGDASAACGRLIALEDGRLVE